jgi:hypothetical protein
MYHDGKQLVEKSNYRGNTCIECAPRIEKWRFWSLCSLFGLIVALGIIVIVLIGHYA